MQCLNLCFKITTVVRLNFHIYFEISWLSRSKILQQHTSSIASSFWSWRRQWNKGQCSWSSCPHDHFTSSCDSFESGWCHVYHIVHLILFLAFSIPFWCCAIAMFYFQVYCWCFPSSLEFGNCFWPRPTGNSMAQYLYSTTTSYRWSGAI